jgi:MFS family permease
VGAFYLVAALPSCLCSLVAGPMGNRIGRRPTVMLGCVLEGGFMMLSPKDNLLVEVRDGTLTEANSGRAKRIG